MKKAILLLSTFLFAAEPLLFAKEARIESKKETFLPEEDDQTLNEEKKGHTTRETNSKNWIFAGSALTMAVVGILAVSFNQGSKKEP